MRFSGKKILSFISFGMFIYIIYIILNQDIKQQQLEINLNHSYNGIIKNKFIDKFEHNWPVIVLKNNQNIYIPDNIYQKVEIKDSIIKVKNNLQVKIFRDSQEIELSY